MAYVTKFWRLVTGEQEEVTQETRPACPGNFLDDPGCTRRPDHVITWTENRSGIPGLGKRRVYHACYRHAHVLLKHAEKVGVFAVVSEYKGV